MGTSDNIQVVMAQGAMGRYPGEPAVETLLRRIAVKFSENPEAEWAEKYGTTHDDEVFMMHPYCWCEKDECPWCNGTESNFRHKETGFEARWYKYIGRSMEYNMRPPIAALRKLAA